MKFRVWQLLVNRYRSIICNQVRVFLSCILNTKSGKIPCSPKKEQLIAGYLAVIVLPWICQSFDQIMYGPTMSLSPSPSTSACKHWVLVIIKPILQVLWNLALFLVYPKSYFSFKFRNMITLSFPAGLCSLGFCYFNLLLTYFDKVSLCLFLQWEHRNFLS